jgi:3-deoxy-D-manno-octulosonic-acid transferase
MPAAPIEGTGTSVIEPPERPDGVVLWMHATDAATSGPLPALAQELSRLRGEPVHALLTSSRGQVPAAIRHSVISFPAPPDTPAHVRGFLDHCRPDFGVVLGLPDRPVLFEAANAEGIGLILAFPSRSVADRRLPLLAGSLLHLFDICMAPSGEDARLIGAAAPGDLDVITTGPVSDTALTFPCDETELTRLASRVGSRPVWLAHQPQVDEIEAIEAAHRVAARSAHRLLLILVPPKDAAPAEISSMFTAQGWRTALRSEGLDPDADVQVFIADAEEDETMGEDELWFRLAPIVFCGGTLSGTVQSDPFRAAAHGTAIIHGPVTPQHADRFARLGQAVATLRIDGPDELGEAVRKLLSPDVAAELALAGWTVVSESAHVIDGLARMIDEALDLAEEARAAAR